MNRPFAKIPGVEYPDPSAPESQPAEVFTAKAQAAREARANNPDPRFWILHGDRWVSKRWYRKYVDRRCPTHAP